jgi:beta-lactamase regulating signal transducer with metallopeptidase domain
MRPSAGLALIAAAVVASICFMAGADNAPSCGAASRICAPGPLAAIDDALDALAAVALAIVAALTLSILWQARRHRRLATLLEDDAQPALVADHSVLLVSGLATPYVAGLARPQIYFPSDLTDRLTDEEVRAVVLHERHHQVTHAPMRLVALAALGPVVGHVGVGRRWSERRRAAIEIAADEHALRFGASRPDLARALLKLGQVDLDPALPSYASASELRLRHLIDGTSPKTGGVDALVPLVVILGSVLVCATRGLFA